MHENVIRLASTHMRRRKFTRRSLLTPDICSRSLDLLQEGMALLDVQGVIRLANSALERILDPRTGEAGALVDELDLFAPSTSAPVLEHSVEMLYTSPLVGERIERYISPDFIENFNSMLDLLDYSGEALGPFQMGMLSVDGKSLQIEATLGVVHRYGQKYTAMLVQDITDWNEVKTSLEMVNLQLEQSYSATLEGWARTLELRDLETSGHTARVVKMTGDLAERMGMTLEELIHVRHGALMHDIGKIAIPDNILKKPGKLTAEEWVEMRKHTIYARDLMEKIEYLRPAIPIPYGHHERWDGTGYPQGQKGEKIPLSARMFAVIDVWDALSHPRVFRPEVWDDDRIMAYLFENAEKQFDPDILRVFSSYM